MLFNSYSFIFFFLPITVIVFFKIGSVGHHRIAIAWLVGASLFFYGWWNPAYLGLILTSILFNYAMGMALGNNDKSILKNIKRNLLIIGIAVNLGLLGYFKYANFFIDNFNAVVGTNIHIGNIILPLAISFFTFQQIAYLVDAYRGETHEYSFLHYCLFVTFFPQLIAGPIVHHKEMLPQFARDAIYRFHNEHVAVGLTIFSLGLFKKVVIADGVAVYGTPVFDAASNGAALTFFEAWAGTLAYTFQLYFDFSGYSDMAIGLARIFGIRLPVNFNSPYKAINITEFWRHWHMTLSRFLRDYVYIPMGGKRNGNSQRYINLMITMLLGGLWHGAGWTFVLWGALHGLYLVINHGWHALRRTLGHDLSQNTWWGRGLARLTTFTFVVIAWVFFRAESFDAAERVLIGMSGVNGFQTSEFYIDLINSSTINHMLGLFYWRLAPHELLMAVLGVLLLVVWIAPNTQQLMSNYQIALEAYRGEKHSSSRIRWNPTRFWGYTIAGVALWAITGLSSISEFLYFQF